MSQLSLIEETGDRAAARILALLNLITLAFESGETRAQLLAQTEPGRIIDPVASACFAEARALIERVATDPSQPRGDLFTAVFALDLAADREPDAYASAYRGVRELVRAALDETVAVELAAAAVEAGSRREPSPAH